MSLREKLRQECIRTGSAAVDRDRVLDEIAALAKRSPILAKIGQDEIRDALAERERLGSTAFAPEAALPHCSFDGLDDFVVGVLTVPGGVDFASLDGAPTKLFFFIIGPKDQRNEHIRLLSTISKVLKTPGAKDGIVGSDDPGRIRERVFAAAPGIPAGEEKEVRERCMFHVFIQREELFNDILEVFTGTADASVTILETNSAGSYLHRLPLFAAYWSESDRTFGRLIVASVEKAACNDTIRRISMVADDIDRKPGVLITVQDLSYSFGSLEL